MVIGNKIDKKKERQIGYSEAKKLMDSYGFKYVEVSAKTGLNCELALAIIARDVNERFSSFVHVKKSHLYQQKSEQKSHHCNVQ